MSVAGNDLACEPTEVLHEAAAGAAPKEVKLSKAPSVAGRILDPHGLPAVGAFLAVDGLGIGATDTEGRFASRSLAPGDHVLSVQLRGAAPASVRVDGLRLGEAREELTVRLMAPASLSGRIIDSKGIGVAGARVKFECLDADGNAYSPWWESGPTGDRTETDAEGRFRFEGFPPGMYRLEARSRARGRASQDASLSEGQSLQLPDLRLEEPR
ncbi:MAG: carboxypeptidase regulatory-like domain-containing protein [Planctomycetes bacterium]|nr:carboxypeptidase regulatory-like domain-containing protein [Planctomycetota bacterium]